MGSPETRGLPLQNFFLWFINWFDGLLQSASQKLPQQIGKQSNCSCCQNCPAYLLNSQALLNMLIYIVRFCMILESDTFLFSVLGERGSPKDSKLLRKVVSLSRKDDITHGALRVSSRHRLRMPVKSKSLC